METVKTVYRGEYRTEATHVQSSQKIITDAPLDNKGKGDGTLAIHLLIDLNA